MTDTQNDGRIAKLKNVRGFYTQGMVEAKPTVEGGDPKYNCIFVLETDKPEFDSNKKAIVAALNAASEKQWKKADVWKTIVEDDPKRCAYRKGERFKNKEGQVYNGFAGHMALSVAGPSGGKRRPVILDRRKKKVTEPSEIEEVVYGGTYCDIIVSFYGTDKGGKGVFASVEVIRSREEGDRIGGGYQFREDDADFFDDLADDDDFGDADTTKSSKSDDDDLFS